MENKKKVSKKVSNNLNKKTYIKKNKNLGIKNDNDILVKRWTINFYCPT